MTAINCTAYLALCLSEWFWHSNEIKALIPNLKIMISNLLKPIFKIEIYGAFITMKNWKPYFRIPSFFGFFKKSVL